jgi:hypothetical protein
MLVVVVGPNSLWEDRKRYLNVVLFESKRSRWPCGERPSSLAVCQSKKTDKALERDLDGDLTDGSLGCRPT